MIPQRNISLISNTLVSAGGRRIPEAVIERDYVLAWFLTGLARHPLREVLAFKGGTALRRCWFDDYRFSEDLDFTLIRSIAIEELMAGFNEIFAALEAACGLRIAFDREDRHGHRNTHTLYLRYQGPLPAANDMKVDITINEVLCFPLQDRPIQRIYDGFDDLPDGPTVKVYAIKEIVVEKLLALSDRARNEPRDLYDLWYMLASTDLRVAEVRAELDTKLALRQRVVAGMEQAITAKEDRLQRLWAAAGHRRPDDRPAQGTAGYRSLAPPPTCGGAAAHRLWPVVPASQPRTPPGPPPGMSATDERSAIAGWPRPPRHGMVIKESASSLAHQAPLPLQVIVSLLAAMKERAHRRTAAGMILIVAMKERAHRRTAAGMILIVSYDMRPPSGIMAHVKMVPIPPVGMMYGVPACGMHPPPDEIGPVTNNGGRRAIGQKGR